MISRSPTSLRDFYQRTYLPLRLTGSSARTREEYVTALNHLERFGGGPVPLGRLDDDLVAGCAAWLVSNGRAAATANKTQRHLTAIWRLAHARGLVPRPPMTTSLKEPKRIPRAWLTEDMEKLFAAASRAPGTVCGLSASGWWTALLTTLYYTGLRITATMQLRWEHVDESHSLLLVPAELQKQLADQLFELTPDCLAALQANRGTAPWLFPWPYDRHTPQWSALNRRFRVLLKSAGLPCGRRDLFHKIRRTTASYIKAGGGNAQEYLGHSSASVTARYLDPRIVRTVLRADLLPRL